MDKFFHLPILLFRLFLVLKEQENTHPRFYHGTVLLGILDECLFSFNNLVFKNMVEHYTRQTIHGKCII